MKTLNEKHIFEIKVDELIWVVLRKNDFGVANDHNPYVVHYYNEQSKGYFSGVYCETLKKAKEMFLHKVKMNIL